MGHTSLKALGHEDLGISAMNIEFIAPETLQRRKL